MIPSSQPPARFQLSHASDKVNAGNQYAEREYSIWVSDLPEDITEDEFHKAFSSRFDSLKTAKLFKEKDNKVYGFVRFSGNIKSESKKGPTFKKWAIRKKSPFFVLSS